MSEVRTRLDELLARVEAATLEGDEPSEHSLLWEVFYALHPGSPTPDEYMPELRRFAGLIEWDAGVDAVLDLVDRRDYGASIVTDPPSARVWSLPSADHDYHERHIVEAATPALALCAALLKALIEAERTKVDRHPPASIE